MAVVLNQTAPTLISTLQHEIYKLLRQRFYKAIVLIPLMLTLVMSSIFVLFGYNAGYGFVPDSTNPLDFFYDDEFTGNLHGLGTHGAFAYASNLATLPFILYSLIVVVACARIVAQEFRYGTLKMIVARQTNRATIVLAKTGVAAIFVGGTFISTIVSWFAFGLFAKAFYGEGFGFSSTDFDGLRGGMRYFGISSVHTFIYALALMGLTWLFTSGLPATFVFLVYKAIDGWCGAELRKWSAPNNCPILRVFEPFFLGNATNRTIMRDKVLCPYMCYDAGTPIDSTRTIYVDNRFINLDVSAAFGWGVLVLYATLFIGLTIYIVARRDVKE